MNTNLNLTQKNLIRLIEASIRAHYKDSWEIYFDSLTEFFAATETRSHKNISEADLCEYQISECALDILSYDTDLLEAAKLFFFNGTKDYKKDKDGKTIVGMHRNTNRYSGSKAERLRAAARAYYSDPEKYEEQKERMRLYYKRKKAEKDAAQMKKDREKAAELDIPLAQVIKSRLNSEKVARQKKRKDDADIIAIRAAHTRSMNAEKRNKK